MSRLRSSAEVKWPEDTPPVISYGEVADEKGGQTSGMEQRGTFTTRGRKHQKIVIIFPIFEALLWCDTS